MKDRLAEPLGQRLWLLSTALSLTHVEQLHVIIFALYIIATHSCKIHLKILTDPDISISCSKKLLSPWQFIAIRVI
jgi:hypothetical protein